MIQDGPGEPIFLVEPTENETAQTNAAEQTPASSSGMKDLAPGALLAFGVLMLVFVVIRMLKRNLARNARTNQGTPRERIEQIRTQASVRNPTEGFQADAEELTRRLAAIMDNKAARLELLIEEADDRLARLDRASLGAGVSMHAPDQDPGAFAPPASEPARAPAIAQTHIDPTQQHIYELSDTGLDPVEIAQRLDQPIGQVELILNLRRRGA